MRIVSLMNNLNDQILIQIADDNLNTPLSDIDRFMISSRKPIWDCSLAWVLKHQTKAFQNNEFPFTEPELKKVETLGNYLNCLFELCYHFVELANHLKFRRNNNISSVSLWYLVCLEIILGSMARRDEKAIGLFKGASTKEELSKNIQKDIKMLNLRQNPYSEIKELGTLIDMCLKISERNVKDSNTTKSKKSDFRNKVWKNFIDSYNSLDLKALCTSILVIDGNKIYKKESGRQKKLIYPIEPSILRQSRQPKNRNNQ